MEIDRRLGSLWSGWVSMVWAWQLSNMPELPEQNKTRTGSGDHIVWFLHFHVDLQNSTFEMNEICFLYVRSAVTSMDPWTLLGANIVSPMIHDTTVMAKKSRRGLDDAD